ncbi:gamma-glutamyltransferase family protein [Acetobacteraceae bacterium H6797]|nr:gamma-glutamyltransferase family protein [Acetobacteraceae bacterium H6797]
MRRLMVMLLTAAIPFIPSAQAQQPVTARHMMVVTASPMATEAALEILRAGGNAVDAAVAAQMALSVAEPHASGLGGGGLMLFWDAKARDLHHYEGLSNAPAASGTSLLDGGASLSAVRRSGRSVAVPGALKMLAMVHARYGQLPWARLFEPAIRLAEGGFPMPAYLNQVLRERGEALRRNRAIAAIYFGADGRPLPVGARITNPEQAKALRLVASEGPGALYGGALGAELVQAAHDQAVPSWIALDDLRHYEARERAPVCGTVFGHRLCTAAPPSSGGIAVMQTLMLAEAAGIAQAGPHSAEATQIFLEASRLATADRRRWIGDPDMVNVPISGLIDSGYIARRARLISPEHAMERAPSGQPAEQHGALPPDAPPLSESATSQVSIIDQAGNAIAFTTTNNLNFGSDVMVSGFVLNNAMTNFSASGSASAPAQNRMAPGKRPATTMSPSIVFDSRGEPELVLGAGGAAWIPDAVAAALVELLVNKGDAQSATAQPRLGAETGQVVIEQGSAAAALIPALEAKGQKVEQQPVSTGLQIIRRLPDGRLEGGADPRRDSVAKGD